MISVRPDMIWEQYNRDIRVSQQLWEHGNGTISLWEQNMSMTGVKVQNENDSCMATWEEMTGVRMDDRYEWLRMVW